MITAAGVKPEDNYNFNKFLQNYLIARKNLDSCHATAGVKPEDNLWSKESLAGKHWVGESRRGPPPRILSTRPEMDDATYPITTGSPHPSSAHPHDPDILQN